MDDLKRRFLPNCRSCLVLSLVVCFLLYFSYTPQKCPQHDDKFYELFRHVVKNPQLRVEPKPSTSTLQRTTSTTTTSKVLISKEPVKSVQIIDIIGIGIWTWTHILQGSLDVTNETQEVYTSSKHIEGIDFSFKLKCCNPIPKAEFKIDNDVGNVILAVWGRISGRSSTTSLIKRTLLDPAVRNLGLIVFGDLDCKDQYILKEVLKIPKLRFAYITHESNMIDDKRVFLWPLGTQMAANHKVRHNSPFIKEKPIELDLNKKRKYTSTFLGTIWDRRRPMADAINHNKELFDNDRNLMTFLPKWKYQKKEIPEGMDQYEYSLINSDLTLSPRGMAAECYRTFEALEFGSIPIISNIVQGDCLIPHEHDDRYQSPYRIFKLHDAPLDFISDWDKELPRIVQDFEALTDEQKAEKRRKVNDWYTGFKRKMERKLIDDVKRLFL